MGTYAEWRLWVGISKQDYDLDDMSPDAKSFINKVMESWADPVERDNLDIVSIGMHGETVGFGVVISELSWGTEIEEGNVFDPFIAEHAQEVQLTLNKIFDELGIPNRAVIYHHLDLGG